MEQSVAQYETKNTFELSSRTKKYHQIRPRFCHRMRKIIERVFGNWFFVFGVRNASGEVDAGKSLHFPRILHENKPAAFPRFFPPPSYFHARVRVRISHSSRVFFAIFPSHLRPESWRLTTEKVDFRLLEGSILLNRVVSDVTANFYYIILSVFNLFRYLVAY